MKLSIDAEMNQKTQTLLSAPKSLWQRWVVANALGEMIGLGATLGVGYLVFSILGEPSSLWLSLLNFSLMVASGAIEGAIVGSSQYWAMEPWFTRITRRAWIVATISGAMVAWFFGSLPFALIDMGSQASETAPVEPAQWIVLLGAAGIGLVAGAVLAFFQWLVLRKSARRAGWWIPANMLAWATGMPLIFWGIDAIQAGTSAFQAGLILAAILLLSGAVVGAIHGAFLVRMRDEQKFLLVK